jgi:hypothetical protein
VQAEKKRVAKEEAARKAEEEAQQKAREQKAKRDKFRNKIAMFEN